MRKKYFFTATLLSLTFVVLTYLYFSESSTHKSGIIHDPIEKTEEYEKIIAEVEKEVEIILKDDKRGLGFCHKYWATKKKILKEKYGIDWKTPAEMNPYIIFD